jgi:hypothetical protein
LVVLIGAELQLCRAQKRGRTLPTGPSLFFCLRVMCSTSHLFVVKQHCAASLEIVA